MSGKIHPDEIEQRKLITNRTPASIIATSRRSRILSDYWLFLLLFACTPPSSPDLRYVSLCTCFRASASSPVSGSPDPADSGSAGSAAGFDPSECRARAGPDPFPAAPAGRRNCSVASRQHRARSCFSRRILIRKVNDFVQNVQVVPDSDVAADGAARSCSRLSRRKSPPPGQSG